MLPIEPMVEDRKSINSTSLTSTFTKPAREEILNDLVPRPYNRAQTLRCVLESIASEHGARMDAMESATSNADEMINKLTIQMNRTLRRRLPRNHGNRRRAEALQNG
jgi:F-type H+-transporting ATPase subunit gamma